MIKLRLYPPSGTIRDASSIKFEISNVNIDSVHVDMENATYGSKIDITSFQKMTDGTYMGIMDLKIPQHLPYSSISIFAYIKELQSDGKLKTVQICPTIFTIKDEVEKSKDQITISPSFIGSDDLCSISIPGQSHSRKVISINDKFFKTIINDKGWGTVSFKGEEVIKNVITDSVKQLPVYIYNEEDNFTKRTFSNTYLNILPASLMMHANSVDPRCDSNDENYVNPPGSWTNPPGCVQNPDIPNPYPTEPTIPPNALPTTCREETVDISDDNICKLFNNSATLLNNGMVIHAYLSPDITYNNSDDPRFNINRVFFAKQQTSLDVQIIANRDVVIEPKEAGEPFYIHVQDDFWNVMSEVNDTSGNDIYVVLFNEVIGFQRIQIIDRTIDEYTGNPVLVGEMEENNLQISNWLFCVNAVFYHASETPALYIDPVSYYTLPYIRDNNYNYIQVVNVSVACNSQYIGDNEESYVYFIAEALTENNSQLFFSSLTVGKNNSINREILDWIQLTYNGNNQHPVAKVSYDNNLHVVWEGDRGSIRQIYYGVLGLSSTASAGTAFSSCLDKYSEFLSREDVPFSYWSGNLLKEAESDGSYSIPEYDSESLVNSNWDIYYGNGGSIVQSATTNYINDVTIIANAVQEDAIAFNSLEIVETSENPSTYDSFPYSQLNYQISFDFTATVTQTSSLSSAYNDIIIEDKIMDNIFDDWKNEFVLTINSNVKNQPVYIKDNNKFILGRTDHIYDRIVPFVGSYKHDTLNPSAEHFQIDITKQNNNLKDYTFGLMFEKTRFTATNIATSAEFSEENPSTISYIEEETHTIYTGKARLVIFIKTEDMESDRANYIIIREFPEDIYINEEKNYTIIINYTKLNSDEVATLINTYNQTYPNRFLGQITLLIDDLPRFSQSFVSTLSNDYNYFDIGLGIPYGGYYIADKMSPSKLGVFDNVETSLVFRNITITSPTFSYNSDFINIPDSIRDMTRFRIDELNPSVSFDTNLLNMGAIEGINYFTQIPLTFEGINQSGDIDLGICNDIHLTWQSNRDRYWNIFYSSSVNKLSPFRFDTRITNTESNSLRPTISVNRNGSRLIAWHDDRNGNYDIFVARSVAGYDCNYKKCEEKMVGAFENEIVQCNISIEYESVAGTYALSLEFYLDAALTKLYKSIDINENNKLRWFIDNTSIIDNLSYDDNGNIEGIIFSIDNTVNISYTPNQNDDIFDKILYVKLKSIEVVG
jgi:hypothetical protein